eukprot:1331314-Pleurochrysis_carterae.AAC.1
MRALVFRIARARSRIVTRTSAQALPLTQARAEEARARAHANVRARARTHARARTRTCARTTLAPPHLRFRPAVHTRTRVRLHTHSKDVELIWTCVKPVRPSFPRDDACLHDLRRENVERFAMSAQRGHAKWDGAKEELVVTLPVVAQIQ